MKKVKIYAAIGVIALAGLMGIGTQTASAHTPTASITCDIAKVSLVSYDAHATAKVTVDGSDVLNGEFGGNYVHSFGFGINYTGIHSLVVHVVSQDGAQYNYDFSQTVTGCQTLPPSTVTGSISATHVTCVKTTKNTFTLKAVTSGDKASYYWNVSGPKGAYSVGGTPNLANGTWPASQGAGVYAITLHGITGSVLDDNLQQVTKEFKVTFKARPTNCTTTHTTTHHTTHVPPATTVVSTHKLAYTGGTIAPWEYPTLFSAFGLGGLLFFLHLRKRRTVA